MVSPPQNLWKLSPISTQEPLTVVRALRFFGVPPSPTDKLDTWPCSLLPHVSCYSTRRSVSSPYI